VISFTLAHHLVVSGGEKPTLESQKTAANYNRQNGLGEAAEAVSGER
jgi:hypothetical protein